MNILFISPNSPKESVGGIERYISNLLDYCGKYPETKAFLIMPTSGLSSIEKNQNVVIYYENSLSIPRNAERAQKEVAKKAGLFAIAVENIIKKHSIDIICAENFMFGPPAVYSLRLNMLAALLNVPVVLRLHMYPASPLQIELVNQLMWKQISCVSKSVAGDCFQKGTDIDVLSTDYLGVNTAEFNQLKSSNFELKKELGLPSDTKIVLTAARIIRGNTTMLKEKGLINLIQAFSKLSPRYPDLRLVIAIGKASENLKEEFDHSYDMLLGYLRINHIESTTILKMFELNTMPDVYKGSDLFVLPSEMNETFGQTFIEAMSCGIPVIGANTGGIPEIISDSYNGYLVPPNDSSILEQRIETLLNDNSIRNKFIKNGLKTVADNFTSEKQFAKFINMLEETAAGAKISFKQGHNGLSKTSSMATNIV